jgi:hypothetical protein
MSASLYAASKAQTVFIGLSGPKLQHYFLKAVNALRVLVEQELGLNPVASALYDFTNRHHNRINALNCH